MDRWTQIGLSALVTGTVAGLVSSAALAVLARAEGRGALQPVNATSHWLHGDEAARHAEADIPHSLVGHVTHYASAVFWALPFEALLAFRPPRNLLELWGDAAAVSAVAAAVDYGATPKRLTPGWELVLSRRSMVGAFGALAAGLAAGAMISERLRERL